MVRGHIRSKIMQSLLAVQAGAGGLGGMVMFLPIVLLVGYMFYSQQKRQKKWTSMLDQLKTGDKVTTSGGLRGTIIALKDDAIHLRVPPDNLRVEVTKASVTHVTTADEEAKAK
jgi:preprotein translocase subunit YajC